MDVPVLIVGGGPVGLGLALDLGWRGVPCMLVEQGAGTITFPRANGVNIRTMEFCRRWGVADAVRRAGPPPGFPHASLYLTSFTGYEIARFDRPIGGSNKPSLFSPVSPQRCNQIWFDPILREAAESYANTTLRYRCRFDSFVQDADGVTATLTDLASGEEEPVRAGYLVACCGGRSSIRKTLGIRMEGLPDFGDVASIAFRAPDLWSHHDKGKAALIFFVGPKGIWSTMISLNGRDLWMLSVQLSEGEPMPSAAEAEGLLRRTFGADFPDHELLSVTPWVRRELVADRYGEGRVLLAGDCAHMNGPEGGYGMNTGMADAVDLGWKLEAAIAGWGGSGLISSYEAERRPVALRTVAEATRNKQNYVFELPAVLDDTAEGVRQRQQLRERLVADSTRRHGAYGMALGHRYVPSPVCFTEPDDAPPEDMAHYAPSSRPGHRAPHVALRDGRSIIDHFGRGFVLLRFGPEAPDPGPLSAAARKRRVPLSVVAIDDPDACALYEKRLVLVRPDGHVAWRGDALPADPVAVIDRVRGA